MLIVIKIMREAAVKEKKPFIGIPRPASPAQSSTQSGIYRGELFTVGNSEIPDFCLSSPARRENP